MKKLRTILYAVFTLMLVNTTVQADSSNFAGPYVGLTASGYGMQMDGASTTGGDTSDRDEVSLGQVAPVTGIEVGYAIPIGSAFLIDVGGSYFQGEAKISYNKDGTSGGSCTSGGACEAATARGPEVGFTLDDLRTIYISPTLVLSDTSSIYLKVGLSEADIGVTGDVTTPANLSGTTWALGTRTVLDSGIFVRTEAGYTDYNGIHAHGKGTQVSTDNSYSAEPTIAFGAVSLGFRF